MAFVDEQNSAEIAGANGISPSIVKSLEGRLPLAAMLNMFGEFVVLLMVGYFSDWFYHQIIYAEAPSDLWLSNAISAATIFLILQASAGKYSASWILSRSLAQSHLLRDWLITFSIVLSLSFLSKHISVQSRGAYILFGIFGFLSLVAMRKLVFLLLAQAVKNENFITRNVVLIGEREEISRYYANEKLWNKGIRVAGSVVVENAQIEGPVQLWVTQEQLRINLSSLDQLAEHLRFIEVDDIVIALPWAASNAIKAVLDQVSALPCAIYLAPDPAMSHLKSQLGGQSNLSNALRDSESGLSGIRVVRRPLTPLARLSKRGFDVVASGIGLVVLSPLLVLIALLIRLETPGSPVFRQKRNGFNERPFYIYKFRSMVVSNEDRFSQTKKNDRRITRLGAFIRRTNLDELPQLINVFLGSMSLVGPRPHALEHNNEFMTRIAHYANRHHVKPGITGWAQINGWRGAAEDQSHMAKRIEYDLEYIQNWSFSLDLKIIFYTFFSKKAFINAF